MTQNYSLFCDSLLFYFLLTRSIYRFIIEGVF